MTVLLQMKPGILNGQIRLRYATEIGNSYVVLFLVEQGADLTNVDESGRTALQVARDNGHSDIVDLLEAAEIKCRQLWRRCRIGNNDRSIRRHRRRLICLQEDLASL
ncbi:hypothetical protein F5X98DRAFT_271263 [Xylaria grammica]|nr:hypothetical protein F5X98DRAFT_271263 [Xylaria grammica]